MRVPLVVPLAFVALAAPAHARVVAPSSFPAGDGALPVNARPVLFATEGATFVRVDGDARTPLDADARAAARGQVAFTLAPGALEAGGALVVEGTGAFVSTPNAWPIEDHVDEAPPVVTGALAVEEVERTTYGTTGPDIDFVVLTVERIDDDSGAVLLRVEGDEIDEVLGEQPTGDAVTFGVALPAGAPRTTCLRVFAADVAANETELGEACAGVGELGCASALGAPWWAPLALLVLRRKLLPLA